MNKKLLTIAVATAMAMPMVANAGGKSKVYGKMHVAAEMVDPGGDADPTYQIGGQSRKGSRIGAKGEIDTNLMDFKGIGQIELGLNQGTSGSGSVYERDSWVGLSSKSLGTLRMGTMATSYKQSGKMVDPLFTTALEGRGSVIRSMSSRMHAGTGEGRGRSTHTVRYDSPTMSGAKVIVNYNANPSEEDNIGLGIHWKGGPAAAFFDAQMIGEGNGITDKNGKADSGNAMKIGGKYTMGDITVSGQYEIDGGAISKNSDGEMNMLHLSGAYNMGATTIILSFGMAAESDSDKDDESTGFGLAVSQKLAKGVSGYAGWGMSSGGKNYNDDETLSAAAVGLVASF